MKVMILELYIRIKGLLKSQELVILLPEKAKVRVQDHPMFGSCSDGKAVEVTMADLRSVRYSRSLF